MIGSRAKDGGAYADMRCAFLRGDLVIAGLPIEKFFNPRSGNGFRLKPFKRFAHAHLKYGCSASLRSGHQAAHVEPRQFGGVLRERKQILHGDATLLRFVSDVDLNQNRHAKPVLPCAAVNFLSQRLTISD